MGSKNRKKKAERSAGVIPAVDVVSSSSLGAGVGVGHSIEKVSDEEVKEVEAKESDTTLPLLDQRAPAPYPPQSDLASGSQSTHKRWRDLLIPEDKRKSEQIAESEHRQEFIHFIQTYTSPGHQHPTFKNQVLDLARGANKLQIHFNYLLDGLRQNKKLLGLCLRVGNNDSHSWLSVTKEDLVIPEWLKEQQIPMLSNMKRCVEIEFLSKPTSMVPFTKLLGDKLHPATRNVPVLSRTRSAYASTSRGKLAFKAAVISLVSQFKHDRWYPEEFDMDEFFLMNTETCYICKTPATFSALGHLSRNAAKKKMADGKASNLKSLWKVFESHYTITDGHTLPIYFGVLKNDMTAASTDIVTKEWFLTYLEKNFCWTSPMCRKTFTCDFQLITKSFDLKSNAKMKSLLFEVPPGGDWRKAVRKSGDKLLNSVFWYGIDLAANGLQIYRGYIDSCEWSDIPFYAYERARLNTIAAVIEYKRNLIEHLCDHLRREAEEAKEKSSEIKITDFDEIELFASSSQPPVEQRILKFLIETCPAEFEGLMEFYNAALSSSRDLPK